MLEGRTRAQLAMGGIKNADKRLRLIRPQFNVSGFEGGQVVLSLAKKKT